MTKQPTITPPTYGKAERKAEQQIDAFLSGIASPSTSSILSQLEQLSR
jgi:hypothetical protein